MIRISIVVLNWNGKEDTLECLKSLIRLRVQNFNLQIIVVDNASQDGSVRAIKAAYKNAVLLKNGINLGFAGGNNVGLRHALDNDADFMMVLNNDTLVDKELVVGLFEAMHEYKDAGVISPKIYFAPGFEFHKDRYPKKVSGKVLWYAGGKMDWDNVLGSNRGVDEIDRGQYDEAEETDFTTGACMFIRREALEKVGLFDEKYFMYLEDVDFCQRTREVGFGVMYAPRGYLWHKVARSSKIGGVLNDYYITRNRLLFGMRYAPLRAKGALLRETIKILFSGREWQRHGVLDFYLGRYGKGSFAS